MFSLIFIYKRDFLKVKLEIYHQMMGMITKDMFKSLFFIYSSLSKNSVRKSNNRKPIDNYTNRRIQQYHTIIVSISIDYKEQIVIIDIKLKM